MITTAKYAQDGSVTAIIDGQEVFGITESNWRWRQVQEWGGVIEPYIPNTEQELTKIFKPDIWRRASDAEAVAIKTGLLQQPVRLQELWASVSYISTTDELYTALRAGFVAAFGEARTNELLEATE